jgi:hypothetical protein
LLLTAVVAAASPIPLVEAQNPENAVYFIDLPPKTTLWGAVMFFSDDLVELTVATAKEERRVRGRFKGQRLAEHSWRNDTSQPQRIAIRGRSAGTGSCHTAAFGIRRGVADSVLSAGVIEEAVRQAG